MDKHKIIYITQCIVCVCISSCYLSYDVKERPFARQFLMRVVNHMGEGGVFPYNPKGQEYCLYDMITVLDPDSPDCSATYILPSKNFPSSGRHKPPCDLDHTNKRVTNSVMKYINRPNLYFESNPENAIVILEVVDKKKNAVYVHTSDLKMLIIEDIARGRKDAWPSFLGMKVSEIHDKYTVTLYHDYLEVSRQLFNISYQELEEMYNLKPGALSLREGRDNGEIHDK